jgi:hypothetical protein
MTQPFRDNALVLIALLAPVAWLGCAGGTTPGPGGSGGSSAGAGGAGGGGAGGTGGAVSGANAQACQALKSGPFSAVVARAVYRFTDPALPAVLNDKKAYRVSLPTPSNVGHVGFKVPAAGEYVVFTNKPSEVAVYDWAGTLLAPTTIASSVSECAEVKTRRTYTLAVDTSAHVIKLGPETAGPIDLALTAATP